MEGSSFTLYWLSLKCRDKCMKGKGEANERKCWAMATQLSKTKNCGDNNNGWRNKTIIILLQELLNGYE
jgi:hypothetical protein